jgi:hypothetical protein
MAKNQDPLEAAKIKARNPPPVTMAAESSAPKVEPPVESNPPSLAEEKSNVVVPTTEGQPKPRKLRVVGNPKKPYRVHAGGQMLTLRHGKIIDTGSYTPMELKALEEHGVKLEELQVGEA